MAVPDRELEFSPLSGWMTRDGVTVQVHIYRFADTDEGWTLEVVDHEDGSRSGKGPSTQTSRPMRRSKSAFERTGSGRLRRMRRRGIDGTLGRDRGHITASQPT
jgi:hypothetical protein